MRVSASIRSYNMSKKNENQRQSWKNCKPAAGLEPASQSINHAWSHRSMKKRNQTHFGERRSYNMSKKNEIQRQSWMNREPAAWGILSRVGTCNAKQSTRMSSIVRDPEWKTNPFWRKTFLQHIEEEWESKTIINELQTFRCMMRETYMQTLSCRQNPEATANLTQVRTQTTKRTCLQGPQACCCSSADCTACEENNCHFAGTKPGAACGW